MTDTQTYTTATESPDHFDIVHRDNGQDVILARNVLARCASCDHEVTPTHYGNLRYRNFDPVYLRYSDVYVFMHRDVLACDELARSSRKAHR